MTEINPELLKAFVGLSMGLLMVYALYAICWMFDCRVWTTPHPNDVMQGLAEEEDVEAGALHVRRDSLDSLHSLHSHHSHHSQKSASSQKSEKSENSASSELSNLSQQPLK